MSIETGRGYNPEEEEKKRKTKTVEAQTEMVEFLIETASIASMGGISGVEIEKITSSAEFLKNGLENINALDAGKFESVRQTAKYARFYDKGLDETDKFIRKDGKISKKTNKYKDCFCFSVSKRI